MARNAYFGSLFQNTMPEKMRMLLLMLMLLTTAQLFGQSKYVCMSIDDLPVVTYGSSTDEEVQSITDRLVGSLAKANIPAIGFVNEFKLYRNGVRDKSQIGLLEKWLDAGLELGNHVYSHPDFNNLSIASFTAEVTKGERVTKEILGKRNRPIKYFRHPYLHVGERKGKADSLDVFLRGKGYTVAPVTIDNEDYLFAEAYSRALKNKDQELQKKIGDDFVNYIEKRVVFYERQSDRLFGRQIKQIMLLHASALNAEFMDRIIAMFVQHGYTFITMKEALTDTAYATPVTVYGRWGISWIDRWALSQKKPPEFFADEPASPAYLVKP